MKNAITNIESVGATRASLVANNFSRVKMWVNGFTSASPIFKRKGRAVPQVFVNTREVIGRLSIDLSPMFLPDAPASKIGMI